jgi:hypothetical protein
MTASQPLLPANPADRGARGVRDALVIRAKAHAGSFRGFRLRLFAPAAMLPVLHRTRRELPRYCPTAGMCAAARRLLPSCAAAEVSDMTRWLVRTTVSAISPCWHTASGGDPDLAALLFLVLRPDGSALWHLRWPHRIVKIVFYGCPPQVGGTAQRSREPPALFYGALA